MTVFITQQNVMSILSFETSVMLVFFLVSNELLLTDKQQAVFWQFVMIVFFINQNCQLTFR